MKKITVVIAICVLVTAVMPLTVFAHGHGMNATAPQSYSVCNVENCNADGAHYHGDTCYCGHYIGDGHGYHRLCSVRGCTLSGIHEHDGVTCFSHYSGDGHSYHNSGHGNKGPHH